ncbi:MAG: creatininase family protein [Terriglobales bacterium]
MKISEMSWSGVEAHLRQDDRAVLPIGSCEQHCGLSLATDAILAERVSLEAAEPLRVPVFPALPYGVTPYFMGFPGTVSLGAETYMHVLEEILASLAAHGFRRIVVVNGHGGNSFAQQPVMSEIARRAPGVCVKFHNWWNAPATWAKVMAADHVAGHASWLENFAWTRVPGAACPKDRKPAVDMNQMRMLGPQQVRERIGDGNLGGVYQMPDEVMDGVWRTGVEETRQAIAGDWPA